MTTNDSKIKYIWRIISKLQLICGGFLLLEFILKMDSFAPSDAAIVALDAVVLLL